MVSKSVNVSNHSRVSQMQEGVVYCGAVRGGGVENGKISVTRDGAIEVRMGKGASMERGPISRGEL